MRMPATAPESAQGGQYGCRSYLTASDEISRAGEADREFSQLVVIIHMQSPEQSANMRSTERHHGD